ncbi:hypothetical protein [Achromobacter sp. UMC71]|uniref:hypothetical protein n=1 Tax=Achromobacter sp. UMC71 TaxID=1862320 RepID=UPI001603FBF1|nr:hypothetical protein [Achromobacter sp. UMC71]
MHTENPAWSGIKKALHHFSHIPGDSDECKALYGLRNALVHNGSIATRGRLDSAGNAQGPFHRFSFETRGAGGSVVEFPPTPWDGAWGKAPYTVLNKDRFYDLVEEVVRNVKGLFINGGLQVRITSDELVDSFIMTLPHPPKPRT